MNMKALGHLLIGATFWLMSSATFAAATLDNLTVSASTSSVTIGQNSTISINWTSFVSSDANVTGNIVAASSAGSYGNRLGTVRNTLSYNYGQTNGLASAPHVFNETLIIPASLISQAASLGLTVISYTRSFTVTEGGTPQGTLQATVELLLVQPPPPPNTNGATSANPAASELNLQRLSLGFNDSSIVKVVKPKTQLNAVAQINYTGTGLLDALWKVALPASTQGVRDENRLIYIPLRSVRQYLGAGGRIFLQSPKLPTDMRGNYVLTLEVRPGNQVNIDFAQPVILRYAVGDGGDIVGPHKQAPIRISFPRDKALLTERTEFKWQPVPGARAYQLELYLPNRRGPMNSELSDATYDDTSIADKTPDTGLLVPGKRTSLNIGALSRQHLKHGETYLWRIIAIGHDGTIISSSAIREIRIP